MMADKKPAMQTRASNGSLDDNIHMEGGAPGASLLSSDKFACLILIYMNVASN